MANSDAVSQLYLDSFGFGRIGSVRAVSLGTAGNAVITIPLLGGGLTNAGAEAGSGAVIVRRVTVKNATGNLASANVAISVQASGNVAAANAVVAAVILSNLTGPGKYQDLTIAGVYGASQAVTGFTTQCLYVNVNTANSNGVVSIDVFGEVVSF